MTAIQITGNPVDGFHFYGPFTDKEAAAEHGCRNLEGGDWWVAELDDPYTAFADEERPGREVGHLSTIIKAQQDMIDELTKFCDEFTDMVEPDFEFVDPLASARRRLMDLRQIATRYRAFIAEA